MGKGGVIFDFNGTLFWDTEYQEIAWDKYLALNNINLNKTQKKVYIHGRKGGCENFNHCKRKAGGGDPDGELNYK